MIETALVSPTSEDFYSLEKRSTSKKSEGTAAASLYTIYTDVCDTTMGWFMEQHDCRSSEKSR